MSTDHDPLAPHSHDPNPKPPSADPAFALEWPGGRSVVSVADLRRMPAVTVADCYIVSTGHGSSGPFAFTGVTLPMLMAAYEVVRYAGFEVVSGDGFGTRLQPEAVGPAVARPPLLAWAIDSRPMSRAEGLVRLVVPSETDDALKQVKWVAVVRVV